MPKKIFYLCDVDHTLFNHDGEFRYNKKQFELLKLAGASEIFFLTRTDVNNIRQQFLFKTRFELIQKLKEYNITVSAVFTPLDIRFEKTALQTGYKIGDAYKKYMYPVEEALYKVQKHLTNKEFNHYSELLQKQEMISLIDYLVKNKISFVKDINLNLNNDTLLTSLIDAHENFNKSLDNHFRNRYKEADLSNLKLEEVNLNIFATHFIEKISYLSKEKSIKTLQELKQFWRKEINEQSKVLDIEKKAMIEDFYKKSAHYQNILMLSHLRDEKIECSKGLVYQKILIDLKSIKENIIIVFIDDNKKEHTSLFEYHPKDLSQLSLACLHPTWNKEDAPEQGSSIFTSNLENYLEFLKAIFLLQIWQSLDIAQVSPGKGKNKEISKPDVGNCFAEADVDTNMQKIAVFCDQMGSLRLKKMDYPLAASYFKIAYLYNKDKEKTDKIEANLRLALKDFKGSKSPRLHLKPFYIKKLKDESPNLDIFKLFCEKINLLKELELFNHLNRFLLYVANLCEEGSAEKAAHEKAASYFLSLTVQDLASSESSNTTTSSFSL